MSVPCGDPLSACGISWDSADIARFLRLCYDDPRSGCLIWAGAKSRGRGNTAWYGSFTPTGCQAVRAHEFYAVAVLVLRPQTELHHLDHTCPNSLCVCHVECVPISVNLKLRWIRIQVGADPEIDYDTGIRYRMQQFLSGKGPQFFGADAPRLWERYGLAESIFFPDAFDPRWWYLQDGIGYRPDVPRSCLGPSPHDPGRS